MRSDATIDTSWNSCVNPPEKLPTKRHDRSIALTKVCRVGVPDKQRWSAPGSSPDLLETTARGEHDGNRERRPGEGSPELHRFRAVSQADAVEPGRDLLDRDAEVEPREVRAC